MSILRNDLLLRAARGERTARTPVWLMRQAGRFDPEYRRIRERAAMPLEELFGHAELSAEISLLPRRLGVDAIIFFQDILTPLAPMGARFRFRPGPMLDSPIRTRRQVEALRPIDPASELEFVPKTLRIVRQALNGTLPLLGFAGAPLTLAGFLIEGGGGGEDLPSTKAMMRAEPALLHRLLDRLADMTTDYLALQIEAGVDALQLFESLADRFSPEAYREFAHPYQTKVFSRLAGRVPMILFAKEQPDVELMARSGADVLSVGTCVDLADARRRLRGQAALQGNVDHRVIAVGDAEEVDQAVRACLLAGGRHGHILNLAHGILKDTPFENVCRFIETCKAAPVDEAPEGSATG